MEQSNNQGDRLRITVNLLNVSDCSSLGLETLI